MFTIKTLQTNHQALPTLDFLLFLAHATGRPKEWLLANPNYRLSPIAYLRLCYYLWRYGRGYSVAAITGHKEFFGLDFYVNRRVLVPRPETEVIVEEVIEKIKNQELGIMDKPLMLIDVGTGSGCIPIAILKSITTNNQSTNKPITTFATDISRPALRVAAQNAKRHGVNITWLHGNLLEPLLSPHKLTTLQLTTYNSVIITANLPYLTAAEFAGEPSIRREPRLALVADAANGLSLYEKLLQQIQRMTLDFGLWTLSTNDQSLKSKDQSLTVLLEINPPQSASITALVKKYLPAAVVEIKPDRAGCSRMVKITV